jgi:hypothetical protein
LTNVFLPWYAFSSKIAKGETTMSRQSLLLSAVTVLLLVIAVPLFAAEQALKPYLLGYRGPGTIEAKLSEVRTALEQKGFQIVGEYAPYTGVQVIAVTSEALKAAAARSAFGAYGAAMRIALVDTGKELQVSATNPRYFAAAYRMKDGLDDIAASLEQAIGKTAEFGMKEGMTPAKLRKYHYMVMMPYFDDAVELAKYPSHDEALAAIEANLAAKKGGSSKVYRVDLPGKKESVFGVAITEGEGADGTIMKIIDIGEPRHAAHLPYELIVSDGMVYMLHGKFRIALDFPDLTMGTFMKISGAPSAIEAKLKAVAGK